MAGPIAAASVCMTSGAVASTREARMSSRPAFVRTREGGRVSAIPEMTGMREM
ncbi:hypothetical protein SAMN05216275_102190 [Streptosporangium canum]|uniref:Uncharacterized protein n=1 Tax=Streptosporangium canum TaxID=324952 RepID=A0A1I3GRR5_9ACTN|nr:hypothetical protein SAMN05216275_102190 [Streptosporangium canum]